MCGASACRIGQDASGHQVATSFDRYSRPQTVTYPEVAGGPSRLRTTTRYNALGYATGTYDTDTDALFSRVEAVDVLGNVTRSLYGNGVETTREIELDTGYVRRIEGKSISPLSSEVIQDLRLSFDEVGNVTSLGPYISHAILI